MIEAVGLRVGGIQQTTAAAALQVQLSQWHLYFIHTPTHDLTIRGVGWLAKTRH
jgi:hypothetical protein